MRDSKNTAQDNVLKNPHLLARIGGYLDPESVSDFSKVSRFFHTTATEIPIPNNSSKLQTMRQLALNQSLAEIKEQKESLRRNGTDPSQKQKTIAMLGIVAAITIILTTGLVRGIIQSQSAHIQSRERAS